MERTLFNIDDLGLCFVSWCLKRRSKHVEVMSPGFHQAFGSAFESIKYATSQHWNVHITFHKVHGISDEIDTLIERWVRKKIVHHDSFLPGLIYIQCSMIELEEHLYYAKLPPWVRDYAERHFEDSEDLARYA